MSKRLTQAAVVVVVAFAAAQLVRPGHTNPPTLTSHTIAASVGAADGLVRVLDRSCGDCHSNATVWSTWYSQVAPLSWLMAHEVAEGRKAINFSEWAAYTPQQQRLLLTLSCDDAQSGKMPGPYPFFKPETRLSAEDVQTICAAARRSVTNTAQKR